MDEDADIFYNALKLGVQFSGTTKCATLEILHSVSRAEPHCIEGTVDDVTLPQWLEAVPALPRADGQGMETPASGLRFVIVVANWNVENNAFLISLRKEAFAKLQEHLHLPEYFLTLATNYHTRGFKFPVPTQKLVSSNDGFLLKSPFYCPDYIQIAITHDAETNVSTGLAVIRSGFDIIQAIRRGIAAFGRHGGHPLLIPLIFLDNEVRTLINRASMQHHELNKLEERAGQYEYGSDRLGDPLETDFLSATRQLIFAGRVLSTDLARLKSIVLALEQVRKWGHSLVSIRSHDQDSDKEPSSDESGFLLTARVGYLENTCRILILESESEQSRVRALSQAVYQFMAAKDARTNLSLAETSTIIAKASKEDSEVMKTIAMESKRDSSAMKTISILGMIFLPGTFLAAVFAMPVFNWDGDGAPVVKSGFKYYWAATIPLTILVLTTWALGISLPWKKWIAKMSGSSKSHHSKRDIESTKME